MHKMYCRSVVKKNEIASLSGPEYIFAKAKGSVCFDIIHIPNTFHPSTIPDMWLIVVVNFDTMLIKVPPRKNIISHFFLVGNWRRERITIPSSRPFGSDLSDRGQRCVQIMRRVIFSSVPISRLTESLPNIVNYGERFRGRVWGIRPRVVIGLKPDVYLTGLAIFSDELSIGRASIDFRHDCFVRELG